MSPRTFRSSLRRWLFLPLIPAAAFLAVVATAFVTRDPELALFLGGPALLAAALLFLALRVKRFEIDADGVTVRTPFQRLVVRKFPFSSIDLSVQAPRWPYKYGYVFMYAIREGRPESGIERYLHLLGKLDLRGLTRDDIDWVVKHPGLKVESYASIEECNAAREALFESKRRAIPE
jgi:hypothetical protein